LQFLLRHLHYPLRVVASGFQPFVRDPGEHLSFKDILPDFGRKRIHFSRNRHTHRNHVHGFDAAANRHFLGSLHRFFRRLLRVL